MPDDKTKTGAADRGRVSLQDHEVRYLARKWKVGVRVVREIIEEHGPSRDAVEAELKRRAPVVPAGGGGPGEPTDR